ncbi:MAG: hypothetical protein IPJ76_08770 [Flavobacteriales bacterium]|nr:MAG: hypothetical protein IPJ76_08770 [Flavobacteriales bacterium]
MRLQHIDRHTVRVVSSDGHEMGRLVRTGYWRPLVEITTSDGVYRVRNNLFTAMEVLFNGHCVVRMRAQWHGAIELHDLSRPDRSLTVKRPSIWRHEHHLVDANGHVHAVITSRYNWNTWRMEHALSVPVGEEAPSVVALLAAVHAIDERRRRTAAAGA